MTKTTFISRWMAVLIGLFMLFSCGGGTYDVKNKHPLQSTTKSTKNIKLNVYIENSGSMDGYMHPSSEFKNDLYSYIGALSSEVKSTKLNYINSQIIPINQSVQLFFQNLTPASFKMKGANLSYSEIVQMIAAVLEKTDKNTVSIFASDCILDIPSGAANNYFSNRRITLRDVIKRNLNKNPQLAIEIIQTSSKFDGFLFPPSSKPVPYKGDRPYYVWVIGAKDLVGALNERVNPKVAFLSGKIKNIASFAQCGQVPFTLYYSGKESNQITIRGKKHEFDILADLSSSLLPDTSLSDLNTYTYKESKASFKSVERIKEISSPYTHSIHVEFGNTSKPLTQIVSLHMNEYPAWADQMNDDKSGADANKTFGIKHLIYAVADAYAKATPAQLHFEISKH